MRRFFAGKLVVLCVISAMILCASGCGIKSADSDPRYSISLGESFICSEFGDTLLVLDFYITNNSDEQILSSEAAYGVTVKLDGTALEASYLSDQNENYVEDAYIGSGATGKGQAAFILGDSEEGEITITDYCHSNDDLSIVEVLNETMDLASVTRDFAVSDFAFKLDNATVAAGGSGESVIILDMTFTNNSDEAAAFDGAVGLRLLQNGIDLNEGVLSGDNEYYDEDLDENSLAEIQGGSNISVRKIYELLDDSSFLEFGAFDRTVYSGDIELFSCEIQLSSSKPALADSMIIAEISENIGKSEILESTGSSDGAGEGETNGDTDLSDGSGSAGGSSSISGTYVNFDDMCFYINGEKYTLGVSTLQDMIDGGVPFDEDDIEKANSNVSSDHISVGYRIDLAGGSAAQVCVLNDTELDKPASECFVSEIYFPQNSDGEQSALSFDFPLDMTSEELAADSGEADSAEHYVNKSDSEYFRDVYTYEKKSEVYLLESSYVFEFIKGELKYVTLTYIP